MALTIEPTIHVGGWGCFYFCGGGEHGDKQFDGDDAEVVENGWNSLIECEEGAVGEVQHY